MVERTVSKTRDGLLVDISDLGPVIHYLLEAAKGRYVLIMSNLFAGVTRNNLCHMFISQFSDEADYPQLKTLLSWEQIDSVLEKKFAKAMVFRQSLPRNTYIRQTLQRARQAFDFGNSVALTRQLQDMKLGLEIPITESYDWDRKRQCTSTTLVMEQPELMAVHLNNLKMLFIFSLDLIALAFLLLLLEHCRSHSLIFDHIHSVLFCK